MGGILQTLRTNAWLTELNLSYTRSCRHSVEYLPIPTSEATSWPTKSLNLVNRSRDRGGTATAQGLAFVTLNCELITYCFSLFRYLEVVDHGGAEGNVAIGIY